MVCVQLGCDAIPSSGCEFRCKCNALTVNRFKRYYCICLSKLCVLHCNPFKIAVVACSSHKYSHTLVNFSLCSSSSLCQLVDCWSLCSTITITNGWLHFFLLFFFSFYLFSFIFPLFSLSFFVLLFLELGKQLECVGAHTFFTGNLLCGAQMKGHTLYLDFI